MAITEVGSGSQRATIRGDGVDSAPGVYPANVTAGSLLVVCGVSWNNPANTSVAVTDTLGTSYTVLLAATGTSWAGGGSREYLAYGTAPTSGACTVTVDPNGTGNYLNGVVDEFTGAQALALDVNGGESTGSSTTPSDALTTLTANSLIIGVLAGGGGGDGIAPGSGLTQIDEDELLTRNNYSALFKIGGSAGADLVDWVLSTTQGWSVYTAAFKESAGGPPPAGGGIGLYSPRGTTQPVASGWA